MVDKKNKNKKNVVVPVDDDEDADVEVTKSKKGKKTSESKKPSADAEGAEEDDVKGKLNSAHKIEAELGELPADISASLTGTIGKAGKSKKKDSLLGVDSSINALM